MKITVSILSFLLLSLSLIAQNINVEPSLTHLTPISATGNISLTPTGGVEPYVYSWTRNGELLEDIGSNLIGVPKGTYKVTITDANQNTFKSKYLLYNVGTWESFEGVGQDGMTLIKNNGNSLAP